MTKYMYKKIIILMILNTPWYWTKLSELRLCGGTMYFYQHLLKLSPYWWKHYELKNRMESETAQETPKFTSARRKCSLSCHNLIFLHGYLICISNVRNIPKCLRMSTFKLIYRGFFSSLFGTLDECHFTEETPHHHFVSFTTWSCHYLLYGR